MVRRVLVVGGAGVFRARLVAGLITTTAFNVTVAGRRERPLAALIDVQAVSARQCCTCDVAYLLCPACVADGLARVEARS